jgi:hypothetical protein
MTLHKARLLPDWMSYLSLQQQSVLILALRGPDGAGKDHPCKPIQRAYRGSVIQAARFGRMLEWGEKADSFMSLDEIADDLIWGTRTAHFFHEIDSLPHHFTAHLAHGAEVLGCKHPDQRFRVRWLGFYRRWCEDLHVNPETEAELDQRLGDWDREGWPNASTLVRG